MRYTPWAIPRVGLRCRHRLSASELTWHRTHPVHAKDAQGIHLITKVRVTPRRVEGTLVPCAKVSHASTVRTRARIRDARRRRLTAAHSHCQGRISEINSRGACQDTLEPRAVAPRATERLPQSFMKRGPRGAAARARDGVAQRAARPRRHCFRSARCGPVR